MEPTIHLQTERLICRDHVLDDLEAYLEMESDPIYRGPQRVHSREEIVRSFREVAMKPKEMGLRATVLRADGRYVGRTGLYPFRDESGALVPGEAFLAYYIARP